jgi:hypothetical protein
MVQFEVNAIEAMLEQAREMPETKTPASDDRG